MDYSDTTLDQWATPRQLEYLHAIRKYGGHNAAATALGISYGTLGGCMASLKRKAAAQGYAPEADMTHTAPPPFIVKGVSSYYDKEGDLRGQWVKTALADNAAEIILRDFCTWVAEQEFKALVPATPGPLFSDAKLLAVYPMGDPHFGLHAWGKESGDDFDLAEAERVTCGAIDRLVLAAPHASRALLANLGDFFHADDSSNETPGHGNKLDVDSRFGKIIQVGLRAMIHCIRRLLEKHDHVTVWNLPGNHDPHMSVMLSVALDAFFYNEPRVDIDMCPSLFKYYRFGENLIGGHHGHACKASDLPILMAEDRKVDWGQTSYRVWLCGHIHHKSLIQKEHTGCLVETFRTLAGKDAWHAGKGYRSGRDMWVITYHYDFGEWQRTRCDIAMI